MVDRSGSFKTLTLLLNIRLWKVLVVCKVLQKLHRQNKDRCSLNIISSTRFVSIESTRNTNYVASNVTSGRRCPEKVFHCYNVT